MSDSLITIQAGWFPIRLFYVVTVGPDPRWSWPEGDSYQMPSSNNHSAHQHSASNVGGDTRDDSAKNNLYLESQNHSFASIMGLFV